MKKQVKASVSVVLSIILLLSSLSAFVYAGESFLRQVNPLKSPWEYLMLSASEDELTELYYGQAGGLTGDIHSNSNAYISGKSATVNGTVYTNGGFYDGTFYGSDIPNVVEGAEKIGLPDVYSNITGHAEENDEFEYFEDDETITDVNMLLEAPIIGEKGLNIDVRMYNTPSDKTNEKSRGKIGAFGAGFLTDMYENQSKWQEVLPAFYPESSLTPDENGKKSLLDLNDISNFIAVQEMSVNTGNWTNYENLAGDVFMANYNGSYVSGYISALKAGKAV